MENLIQRQITRECLKLIGRYHRNVRTAQRDQQRYEKRTGEASRPPVTYEPSHWDLNPQFDPFYVRSRAKTIAHAIAKKIQNGAYEPSPALVLEIPKPSGGFRGISVFPIPDAAVSYYLFTTLGGRNQQFFSSYAYAYRGDRSVHHAIEHLYRFIKGSERSYVLNYDFSKYFDSIGHEYILGILDKYFRVSRKERKALEAFLRYKRAKGIGNYSQQNFETNTIGVPQGSSISLFLANVACLELDLELEREGAVFARYADDTIILCSTYEMAHRCANRMLAHGKRSRTEINFEKSEGISLFTREPKAEMRTCTHFDFLGNRISQTRVTIARKSIRRIKRKISAIIHRHLLLYPSRGLFSANRITEIGLDWDLVTCLNEIRRYLYGSVNEAQIQECLSKSSAQLVMTKCLLSYYPLVDDLGVFIELDGWLLNIVMRAQRARLKKIAAWTSKARLYSREELLSGSWYISDIPNETQLPSFVRSWKYTRKLLKVYGAGSFPVPEYES
jgi:RNA-directed DNA polymerase